MMCTALYTEWAKICAQPMLLFRFQFGCAWSRSMKQWQGITLTRQLRCSSVRIVKIILFQQDPDAHREKTINRGHSNISIKETMHTSSKGLLPARSTSVFPVNHHTTHYHECMNSNTHGKQNSQSTNRLKTGLNKRPNRSGTEVDYPRPKCVCRQKRLLVIYTHLGVARTFEFIVDEDCRHTESFSPVHKIVRTRYTQTNILDVFLIPQ